MDSLSGLNHQQYIDKVHSRKNTSLDVIKDIIFEGTKKSVDSIKKLTSGEINEVYDVKLSSGKNIILRIADNEEDEFRKEIWAISECKKQNVPVADTIYFKRIQNEKQYVDYLIQEKLEGQTLERGGLDYNKIPKKLLEKYINQAGEILAKIHRVKTDGFGQLNESGRGSFKTIKDYILDNAKNEETYLKVAKAVGIEESLMKKILSYLAKVEVNGEARLIHTDFGPKHLVVDGQNITGVLDFGLAQGSIREMDFAGWDYWYSKQYPMEWLIDGYGNKNLLTDDFYQNVRILKLSNSLEVLSWYLEEDYKEMMEFNKSKLLEAFKELI